MTIPRRRSALPRAAAWLAAAALSALPAAALAQDRLADPTRSSDTAAAHMDSALDRAKGEKDVQAQGSAAAQADAGGAARTSAAGEADAKAASAGGAKAEGPAYTLWKLHHGNQMEVQMGELAKAHARSPEVKRFGQRLVTDHTAADAKVTTWAEKLKVDLDQPPPSATDQAEMDEAMSTMDQLKALKGADFDGKFVQAMADDHRKDIALVDQARSEASQREIRPLLDELLPKLRQHQQIALRLQDGHGGAAEKPAGRRKAP